MLVGHVEGFEVVLVVLDLRPFEHLVAEPREDRLDFLAHQAERMAMAERRRPPRQRDVHRPGRPPRGRRAHLALGERLLDARLQRVDQLAEGAPIGWRQRRQLPHQIRPAGPTCGRSSRCAVPSRAAARAGADAVSSSVFRWRKCITSGAANPSVYIKDIDYNEKGQRNKIIYGNDVNTKFYYDKETFRLKRLESKRPNNDPLQDLYYTFDPVGNITHIEDKNIPVVFFDNQKITGSDYTYDAFTA